MTYDDPQPEGSVFTYQVSGSESLSEGVIRTISTLSGSDPVPDAQSDTETGQPLEPLYTVIDPEALDSVFQPTDRDTAPSRDRITFFYHGFEITVRREGRISVKPRNQSAREVAD